MSTKPPPPPGKTNSGETSTQASAPPSYSSNNKNGGGDLGDSLNGSSKICRMQMIGLSIVLILIIDNIMSNVRSCYYWSWYLDEYEDVLVDDSEDSAEQQYSIVAILASAYLFFFFAILSNMYYLIHIGPHGNGSGGPLSVLLPATRVGESGSNLFRLVIVILYAVGIVLYYVGFIITLSYYFDEDWSTYAEDGIYDDDTIEALKINFWLNAWLLPLAMIIFLLQTLFPETFLNVFECRMFLWSFAVCTTLVIYILYFGKDEYYEGGYLDDDEDPFTQTRIWVWLTCILCLAIAVYGAIGTNKVVRGGSNSDAGTPNVYKIWLLAAILLFLFMFALTISSACAGLYYSVCVGLWAGSLMIIADIMF